MVDSGVSCSICKGFCHFYKAICYNRPFPLCEVKVQQACGEEDLAGCKLCLQVWVVNGAGCPVLIEECL